MNHVDFVIGRVNYDYQQSRAKRNDLIVSCKRKRYNPFSQVY